MDIAGLADFPQCWAEILQDWRRGTVDRAAVIRALESGHPMPPEANALLAGLLDGSIKAKPGNKQEHPPRRMDGLMARTYEEIKTMLRHPDRIPDDYGKEWRAWLGALRSRSTGTVSEKAVEATARLFRCSPRRVRDSITRQNAVLKSIADTHGVTVDAVKRGQRYGEP